jgi:hypothetical protein
MPRLLPALLLFLLTLASARAQQQERKLIDRIMKPDQTLEYDVRQSSFSSSHTISPPTAHVEKTFSYDQHVLAKPFDAKTFSGAKTAWFGNFHFATNEARTKGKFEIPNATKKADTKTVPVSAARESSKTMDTHAFAAGSKSYFSRGRSQDRFDKEGPAATASTARPLGYSGELKPLTIDDIRELLNKNK